MLTILLIIFSIVCLSILAWPIFLYFYDAKGFRRYPCQNVLSAISPLAYGWEVGRPHHLFHTQRLHEQLLKNDVVRVGPNWLSFGRAGAVRDIYGFNSPCRKGGIYSALKTNEAQSLILSSFKTVHSVRRRMVAASYAAGNIEVWEPRVTGSTVVLVSKFDAMCTAPLASNIDIIPKEQLTLDAKLWSMLYAFECVIKIGLSKDMAFLAQGSDLASVTRSDGGTVRAHIIECAHSSSRATSTLVWDPANFSWLKKITSLVSPWYAQHWRNATIWSAFIDQITLERIEWADRGENLEDLVQPMIRDRKGTDAKISDLDRVTEVHQIGWFLAFIHSATDRKQLILVVVGGGGDGPGISLVNTLYYLLKNPESMVKLRSELDNSLAADDVIAPWSKIKRMPYLRACINESMRLSPPVAADLPRLTPPDRSYIVAGEIIPPNTNVSISAYTAHRDPTIFTDPEVFDPERWLTTSESQSREMLAAYIPFSAGTRACIGRNVALLMQLVFIATVVHRYDFALPHSSWTLEWEGCFNIWPKELPLKIWRRQVDKGTGIEV